MAPKNEKKSEESITVDERLCHIAFIMDGNGRWAQSRGLPREHGHAAGAQTFYRIAEYCRTIGIRYMTVYAFSTENWKRPPQEVRTIMGILESYIHKCAEMGAKGNIHVRIIGNLSVFSKELQEKIEKLDVDTAHNSFHLNIAINYGARAELCRAVELLRKSDEPVTEQTLAGALYTSHCPDPDMIVRTGGDMRISNFLLWQSAYSELYFTDTLWPDMSPEDVDAAVTEFYSRKRRFGGL